MGWLITTKAEEDTSYENANYLNVRVSVSMLVLCILEIILYFFYNKKLHPWVQIVKDPKDLAAAQVEVVGEAEHQEEILQEAAKVQEKQEEIKQETGLKTEQEAAKVQQEQEAPSGNKQEETGETREDNTKATVVTKDGGTFSKRSLS